jgi:hypothetical protein
MLPVAGFSANSRRRDLRVFSVTPSPPMVAPPSLNVRGAFWFLMHFESAYVPGLLSHAFKYLRKYYAGFFRIIFYRRGLFSGNSFEATFRSGHHFSSARSRRSLGTAARLCAY